MIRPSRTLRPLLAALCLALAAPAGAQEAADDAAARASWRFLDGSGVTGVLRVAPNAATREGLSAIGLFIVRVEDRGVFEGVYNLRGDGRSVIGMLWPEGKLNDGPVAGFLDIDDAGAGVLSFLEDGASVELSAR